MLSPNSTDIFDVSLERKDEDNKSHSWSLWHMNKQYGQNDLQFWEYKTGDDGKTCGSTTGICGPRFSLLAGGGARLENDLTVKGNVTINGISNIILYAENTMLLDILRSEHSGVKLLCIMDGINCGQITIMQSI